MYWVPEDGRRKMGKSKKTWRSTFKETWKRWVSSPVTVRDGDFSSPNAPRGTSRTKTRAVLRLVWPFDGIVQNEFLLPI